MIRKALRLICVLIAVLHTSPALTHALEPGYLELRAQGGDTWRVLWRKPDVNGAPMAMQARLSQDCQNPTGPAPRFDGSAWTSQWITHCPGGLAGASVTIDGLETTETDVLVRYELREGSSEVWRLVPEQTSFQFPTVPSAFAVLNSYTWLGIDHILGGLDHLLFVFALLLLIRSGWKLFGAITAFTLAHSLTLGAAALGWLVVPGPPVEAIIALSIMFLAAEALQSNPGQIRLSERAPWAIAFGFGLIHGLGFGSALMEIGLPGDDVIVALFAFNLGVEIGQLAFVAGVLVLWEVGRRVLGPDRMAARGWATARAGLAYGIGGIAAFWFVSRLAAF